MSHNSAQLTILVKMLRKWLIGPCFKINGANYIYGRVQTPLHKFKSRVWLIYKYCV